MVAMAGQVVNLGYWQTPICSTWQSSFAADCFSGQARHLCNLECHIMCDGTQWTQCMHLRKAGWQRPSSFIISTTITLIITIKCVGLPGWQSYNEARAGPWLVAPGDHTITLPVDPTSKIWGFGDLETRKRNGFSSLVWEGQQTSHNPTVLEWQNAHG